MTTVTQPSTPPHVLLVYDLERLCYAESASPGSSTPPDATLCRILAVLTDSMEFIARATGRSTLMAFFLPITHSAEAPKPLHILLRWLPLALRCHNFSMNAGASHEASHEESECHGQDTYRLEVSYAQSAEHQSTQQIQAITQEKVPRLSVLYSMDKGLVLKDILRNDE